MIDKLKTILPILSVSIVVLSMIKETLFYWCFDLPIKYFIGFSELPFLISESLITYTPIALVIITLHYFGDVFVTKLTEQAISKANIPATESERSKDLRKLKNLSISMNIIFFGFTGIVMISYLTIYLETKAPNDLYNIFSHILAVWYYIYFIMNTKKLTKEPLVSPKRYLIQFISLSLAIILIGISDDVKEINKGKYTGTYIVTDKQPYPSNDTSYFIGKTSDYIFIYNKNKKGTDVIPVGEVKSYFIKTN